MEMLRITHQEIKKLLGMLLMQGRDEIRKVISLFLLLMTLTLHGYTQEKRPINYLIPNVVKSKIESYLKANLRQSPFYIIFQHQNDTTSILVGTYNSSSKEIFNLIANTNRYIRIDSKTLLPVLLQSDLIFSDKLHVVKNKGTSDEIMSNSDIHASGYLIIYKGIYWNISLLKAEYYQN